MKGVTTTLTPQGPTWIYTWPTANTGLKRSRRVLLDGTLHKCNDAYLHLFRTIACFLCHSINLVGFCTTTKLEMLDTAHGNCVNEKSSCVFGGLEEQKKRKIVNVGEAKTFGIPCLQFVYSTVFVHNGVCRVCTCVP